MVINSFFVEYKDINICITGSNAYLLSSELSTYLAGRYVEIKLLPFSFKEFINFNKLKPNKESFNIYIEYGGLPSLTKPFRKEDFNLIIDGICSSVIMKDIIEKVQIKDVKILKQIIVFLSDNIGNITLLTNIKNIINKKNIHLVTIENYISALSNPFLFYEVGKYDIKGKNLLKTLNKYYIVDIGVRNYFLGRTRDMGRILENIVFLELLRRDYKIYTGRFNDMEIDFLAEKNGERTYFQVCETMLGEKTKERELKPLKMVKDNYEKIVLSFDEVFLSNEEGIKHKNIIDWLIEN